MKYRFFAQILMPVTTYVEADTLEEATKIALERKLDMEPKLGWAIDEVQIWADMQLGNPKEVN